MPGTGSWSGHRLSAGTFTVTEPLEPLAISVTAPPGGGTYFVGSSLPVSFTDNQALSGGQFAVWADSGTGWYATKTLLANGSGGCATSLTLNVPEGSTYKVRVGYRPVPGTGSWIAYGLSAGTFTVTEPLEPLAISVTAPPGGGTYFVGGGLPVSFTDNQALSGGQFAVWADSGTGWYATKTLLANGSGSYATSLTLNVPEGSTYKVRVGYRPVPGTGSWIAYGLSAGTFTVAAAP